MAVTAKRSLRDRGVIFYDMVSELQMLGVEQHRRNMILPVLPGSSRGSYARRLKTPMFIFSGRHLDVSKRLSPLGTSPPFWRDFTWN